MRRGAVGPPPPRPPLAPPLPLVVLLLAVGAGAGLGSGQGPGAPSPGGGHNSSGVPTNAMKDLGLSFSFGRGLELDGAIAAVFNKVAYGTTAAPTTTRLPTLPTTSTTAAPTSTRTPPTSTRPTVPPPPPTEQQVPLPPPPPPPAGAPGPVPTRRAPAVPLPEYAPPNRPPPLPAEYNPFANKAILRGSQSDVGSSGPGRKAPPTLLQPRPPQSELIPLPPVNTPSQGQGAPSRGSGPGLGPGGGVPTPEPLPPPPPRPDRPLGSGRSSGKHHLDPHIHTVASAHAPSGPSGHQHDPYLKAAKPTELLDQVNKDPYIGVQAEGAVDSDAAITLDEDNSAKVLVPPATSPPPAQRPAGGAGPDWHMAWTAQTYGLGSLWGALAVLSLLALVWVSSRTRLLPRTHFVVLLALLLTLASINSFSLFYDVLCDPAREHLPQSPLAPAPPLGLRPLSDARVPQLLADLSLPLLPAAFALFFFVIVRVSHVSCSSSRLHSPALLCSLVVFLVVCGSLEGASWTLSRGFLHVVAQSVWVCSAALLGLAYACLYRPLRRAAAKKQAEQLRAAFTSFRRPPSPALPRVVNGLLACAVLILSLAAMRMYRLIDTHLLLSPRDWRSPPWWYLQLAEHVAALTVGFVLLWGATRGPPRASDERSTESRSTRGTPGALSLVSCAGKRFLFDCPSTGSEENNKHSEDNNFPAVCASNHAILNYTQHTGSKLYDDSFPLANLPSAPLCSSGDDFSNVPTMPKRRPARSRHPHNSHGHHTLGPGGQLYEDRDGLPRYERATRTTGRTRKARHYSNCPQDEDYKLDGLDGLADDFQVFKQYASTGSSESADNYDVPMLMSVPPTADTREAGGNNKRHRRRLERGGSEEARPLHRGGGGGGVGMERRPRPGHHDSLSPASPSDLSDCDRLSSNRSSYDEMRPGGGSAHHAHRGKVLLRDRDASEDDVTPDSAVVSDITASSHHSPREKRAAREAKRLARRQQQQQQQQLAAHLQDSPSSPELLDMRAYNSESVWSPQ